MIITNMNERRDRLAADLRDWERETADALKDLIAAQDEREAANPAPGSATDKVLKDKIGRCQRRFVNVDQARQNIDKALQAVNNVLNLGA